MSATLVIQAEAPRAAAAPSPVRLRLTRRGRVVFGAIGTLLVAGALAMLAAIGAPGAQASAENGGREFGYVVVAPGESLWSVASELDSTTDPRDLISEIVRLNQLEGSAVQAGQPIAVPLRYADEPGVATAAEVGLD
ncbi:LysM peptidoglycan-binding domain-containing protein [Leucobacter sp. CSA1]|uniref:LysM peptidoglycan-binding domain-containing protein n=1 Tax=Leucobacter chromiisoli TaxID=2796471 RepID=A0A934Q6N8_9MICO|nr:LysM peptidoglycan-binding domain-containing protein [Leucobacter chromiisoli]MBK0419310.1 LysM peptidoglycan-binding domain-containing protein [Leucobacter chromiisoli]